VSFAIMIPWEERDRNRPVGLRLATRLAIGAARLLVHLPPDRLHRVLGRIGRGARPATAAEAAVAVRSVLSSSLSLNAYKACLPRSIAVALLCRLRGTWATWCAGVLLAPPFAAHAWIEVDGEPVGENLRAGELGRLITIAPHTAAVPRS
jgi:hypothetical protein